MFFQCFIVVIEFAEHEIPGDLSCAWYKDFLTPPARRPHLNLFQRVLDEFLVCRDKGFNDTSCSSLNVTRSRNDFLDWLFARIVFFTAFILIFVVCHANIYRYDIWGCFRILHILRDGSLLLRELTLRLVEIRSFGSLWLGFYSIFDLPDLLPIALFSFLFSEVGLLARFMKVVIAERRALRSKLLTLGFVFVLGRYLALNILQSVHMWHAERIF